MSDVNCCKTTGPLYTEKDIERISKHLRLSPADFEKKYLRIDEDGASAAYQFVEKMMGKIK